MKKINRVGETRLNSFGTMMTIIKYNTISDILVRFDDNHVTVCRYGDFLKGEVKNPYDKSIYGVGYVGDGVYKTAKNKRKTLAYTIWNHIMERCYDKTGNKNYKAYKDCKVCEEWKNYQNFAKWCEENYYEITNCKMQIDKDILIKGNKIYSPETCIFVPQEINSVFTGCITKDRNFPIGVYYCVAYQKYGSRFKKNKKNKFLGFFNNELDAFYAYKKAKEDYIKEIAEKYKDQIPEKLYNALINYEVEITD